jgi:hypothetical protein
MSVNRLVSFQIVNRYLKLIICKDEKYSPVVINMYNISSFLPNNNLSSLYLKYSGSKTLMYLEIYNDFEICDKLINEYLKWESLGSSSYHEQLTYGINIFYNKNIKKKVADKGKDLFQTANILLSLNTENDIEESIMNESEEENNPKRKHKMITRSMAKD